MLVWALAISLAATLAIDVSFSSSGYLDVSVHRVPFHTLWIGVWILEGFSSGFPHSDISGSMDICSSPKLFAAYHVFHRLLVPRHPPCALSSITNRSEKRVVLSSTHTSVYALVISGLFFLFVFSKLLFSVLAAFTAITSDVLSLFFYLRIDLSCMQFSKYIIQSSFRLNGDNEIRTRDLLLARQALSQLSYTPIMGSILF